MLQSFKKILNSEIHAQDGKIGHLDDFLFDDKTWTIRYLVVRTGGFITRDRVLISPLGVAHMDWSRQSVALNLTRQKIESSPSVDTDLPVFRQMEEKYFAYYNWPYYWDDMGTWGVSPRSAIMIGREAAWDQSDDKRLNDDNGNVHLRSCRIVNDYSIEVEGSRAGHVKDFLIDEKTWAIKNLIIDSKNWWPDRPIKIVPASVISVNWFEQCVQLSMNKAEIEATQEYDAEKYVGLEAER